MTCIPFRALLSAGKSAFITCFVPLFLISAINSGYHDRPTFFPASTSGAWLFGLQLILALSVLAFFFGTGYGFGIWIITRLFFRKLLSITYLRNITLLCGITTAVFLIPPHMYDKNNIFPTTAISLWTGLIGNRFATAYLRTQQKQKNDVF